MNVKDMYKQRLVSSDEAIRNSVQSNFTLVIPCGVGVPNNLLDALADNAESLENVRVCQAIGLLPHRYFLDEAMEGHIVKESLYFAGPDRAADKKQLDTIRVNNVHLSDARAFMTQWNHINVFLGLVSPMDKHGFFSLGLSTIYEKDAIEAADIVILEVNENVPRTHGDALVHVSEADYLVESNYPLFEVPYMPPTEADIHIAEHVAPLVPDGATLQLGVGNLPAAIGMQLLNHKNIGVHTEVLADVNVDLWEAGVCTNKAKTLEKDKMVACLAIGSKKLYDFIDDNPSVTMRTGSFTNEVTSIARNNTLISINSSIQIDLCGQVAAESMGPVQFSSTGGQLDWVRGSQMSPGGKSIIALPSTAKDDTISKIVPIMSDGSYITTPRTDVQYVATEHGIVNLRGKPMHERARMLIDLAHPNFRPWLEEEAKRLRILR